MAIILQETTVNLPRKRITLRLKRNDGGDYVAITEHTKRKYSTLCIPAESFHDFSAGVMRILAEVIRATQ